MQVAPKRRSPPASSGCSNGFLGAATKVGEIGVGVSLVLRFGHEAYSYLSTSAGAILVAFHAG